MATLGPNSEFDVARKRAQQQETANLQSQKDAIARRQAQAGGGVSGAFQKQEAIAADESAKRLQTANEGIQAQENAELRRMREIEEGRQFARSEREAGQTFASAEALKGRDFTAGESALGRKFAEQQAQLGREFATSERLGGQTFQEGMLGKQQAFATSEREATQTWQQGERKSAQNFQAGQQKAEIQARYDLQAKQIEAAAEQGRLSREQAAEQLEMLKKQQDLENRENAKTNYINTILSAHNSKMDPAKMSQLLSGIGVTIGPNGEIDVAAPDIQGLTTPVPAPPKYQPPPPAADRRPVFVDAEGKKYYY